MNKPILLLVLILSVSSIAGTPMRTAHRPVSRMTGYVSNQPSVQDIVNAMCLVETDNRPHLRGRSGERGIMQLMRNEWNFTTRKLLKVRWSFDMAYDRDKSLIVGQTYIKYLIDKYGDWRVAVKVYNAGHRGVHKLNRGTRYLNYVKKAMETGNTAWRKAKKRRNI